MKSIISSSAKALLVASAIVLVNGIGAQSASASSLKACVATTGKVSVKARCAKKEKLLSTKELSPIVIAGQKGEIGAVGPQGLQGPAGERGPVGLQGVKGDRGDVGPQGVQGAPGVAGPQGSQGVQGNVGPQGAQGPRGFSAFDVMPSGVVAYGVVGGASYSSSANAEFGDTASLPGLAPETLTNDQIVVKNNSVVDNDCAGQTCLSSSELLQNAHCNGTYNNPTADVGYVCIYPTVDVNAGAVSAVTVPGGSGRFGFYVRWTPLAAGQTHFRAVWAYTAP